MNMGGIGSVIAAAHQGSASNLKKSTSDTPIARKLQAVRSQPLLAQKANPAQTQTTSHARQKSSLKLPSKWQLSLRSPEGKKPSTPIGQTYLKKGDGFKNKTARTIATFEMRLEKIHADRQRQIRTEKIKAKRLQALRTAALKNPNPVLKKLASNPKRDPGLPSFDELAFSTNFIEAFFVPLDAPIKGLGRESDSDSDSGADLNDGGAAFESDRPDNLIRRSSQSWVAEAFSSTSESGSDSTSDATSDCDSRASPLAADARLISKKRMPPQSDAISVARNPPTPAGKPVVRWALSEGHWQKADKVAHQVGKQTQTTSATPNRPPSAANSIVHPAQTLEEVRPNRVRRLIDFWESMVR